MSPLPPLRDSLANDYNDRRFRVSLLFSLFFSTIRGKYIAVFPPLRWPKVEHQGTLPLSLLPFFCPVQGKRESNPTFPPAAPISGRAQRFALFPPFFLTTDHRPRRALSSPPPSTYRPERNPPFFLPLPLHRRWREGSLFSFSSCGRRSSFCPSLRD